MLREKTLSEGKVLIIDIEIAGLGDNIDFINDLIVEIGITAINLFTGEKKIIYNELVNEGIYPGYSDSWIFRNTDMKIEDIMEAKPLDIPYLQKLSQMYYATAFNKKFDFSFFEKRGIHFRQIGCLMELSTPICKIPPTQRMKEYRPWIKYKNPNAEEAYKFMYPDREWVELHRGGDDSKHEADIAKWLYDNRILILEESE